MPIQKEKDKPDLDDFVFKSEFDLDKVQKSADLDIKPKIEFESGIENAKDVLIVGTYYEIDIPKEKAITEKTKLKALNMLHEGVIHQFIAEAESFRYQLEVICYKKKIQVDDIDGLALKIWKDTQYINTPKFKGKADVYCIKAL